jgi:cytochrome P450
MCIVVIGRLMTHPETLARVRQNSSLTAKGVEETLRWHSPVQSATRHVVATTFYGDIEFAAGDTVNCMLGAANRDAALFPDPYCFDIDRPNVQRHLGFATGTHPGTRSIGRAGTRLLVGNVPRPLLA